MEENLSNFVINDTIWSKFGKFIYALVIGIITITVGLPIIFFFVFPLFWEGYNQLFFVIPGPVLLLFLFIGIADWGLIYSVNIFYRFIKPIQKTKLSISKGEFTIYIQNKIYLQIFLNQIEKIEIIKQRWTLLRKINLISPSVSKEILLFLFIFNKKKTKISF